MNLEAAGPCIQIPVPAGTTTQTLAAITPGKRWRIIEAVLYAGASGAEFSLESSSGVDATPLIDTMTLETHGQWVLPFSPIGWGDTDSGMKLHLNVASGAVGGMLKVQQIAG
jgi:hypothetical protein